MKKMFFLMLIALVFVCQAVASEPIGLVVNSNTNGFHLINPLTQKLSPSMLKGSLGSYGGGLFDIEITPNGKTAIISNFGDSVLYFVNISGGFTGTPEILGSVGVPFFAEDIAITPDGKYALVTDGGFSSRCAVIDIATRTMIFNHNLGNNQAQAVSISPNGKVVLFADYWNMAIHSYLIDATGMLTYVSSVYPSGCRPVNVAISPDGKTVIAVDAVRYDCPIFALGTDGGLNYKGNVALPTKSGQSCVFGKDGSKAYYLSSSALGGPVINVINITAPGEGTCINFIEMSIPRGTSQLFGVDTLAVDPSGNYLYVSNPTLSGGVVELTVIDLNTNTEVNQLQCGGIPTGINFATIQ